jgi:bacterioferritin-associated ferredoxin
MSARRGPSRDLICLCNEVPRAAIEQAIRGGADTLNKIFDATTAGVGPCGGSCRRKLAPMLDAFLATGAFPPPASDPSREQKKRR